MVTQAIVFAAGHAQRLMPLTENRPKGMLIVGGRPLLQYAIEGLQSYGVKDIVIVVGYQAEKIQAFFKDGGDFGVKIHYVHQASPTGTLDAVKMALPELDLAKPAIILPGNAYVDGDILKPLAKTKKSTLLVATAGDDHPQGIPSVRGDRLTGMHREVPVAGSTRVATNIILAAPDLLKAMEAGDDEVKDVDMFLGDWAASNAVEVVGLDSPWFTIINPWDLLRLNEWVLENHFPKTESKKPKGSRGPVAVGRNCDIAPTAVLIGPVTIGDGCTIGDRTVIGPYVSIRNECTVGAHSELRRTILNNNVMLNTHSIVRGSIVDDGVVAGPALICEERTTPGGPRGAIIGRDARIPTRATLAGGTIVGVEHGLEH